MRDKSVYIAIAFIAVVVVAALKNVEPRIIGPIGSILASVFTYIAGGKRAERNYVRRQRDERWRGVLGRYMDFRKHGQRGGLDGLQRAGVATLECDVDIRRLIEFIQKHGEKNPLGSKPELFAGIDLKRFFEWSAAKKINFMSTHPEVAIEQFNHEA